MVQIFLAFGILHSGQNLSDKKEATKLEFTAKQEWKSDETFYLWKQAAGFTATRNENYLMI